MRTKILTVAVWSVAVTDSDNILPRTMSPDVLSALQGVCFIAQHIKDADKDNEVRHQRIHCTHLEYSTPGKQGLVESNRMYYWVSAQNGHKLNKLAQLD